MNECEAIAMDIAHSDSESTSALNDLPPPPKKGFRGKRKRGRTLTTGKASSEWKRNGAKRVSEQRATEKAERQKKSHDDQDQA